MEIKYNMKKGAGLVYSWTASATLFFEFHGEPDVKPAGKEGTDYYESYELDDKKGKARRTAHSWRRAPAFTDGSGKTRATNQSTLKLVSAGFFDWISQNRQDKHTALKPMDVYALPSHPKVPDELLK